MNYYNNDYLQHYGVKGMKWGHRKQPTFERDGSKRTVKKLNKLIEADKRYGPQRTARQSKKINKLYQQYDKSAAKDIKKAVKAGDNKSARSITAGRTYLKAMMDSGFLTKTIGDTAVKANVDVGKDFTYNIMRDDKKGGITVTVNGYSDTYTYLPEAMK